MSDLVCIKTYGSRHEAELVRGFLEVNGIKAVVSADDVGGMRPHLLFGGGARLLVKEEDVQEALEGFKDTNNK